MVNPGVDGYTVVKPQINGKSPKNAKRQPTENQKLASIRLASGVKSPLIPPVSYSIATNTLNIN